MKNNNFFQIAGRYNAPAVARIDVLVEQGFAQSFGPSGAPGGSMGTDNPFVEIL